MRQQYGLLEAPPWVSANARMAYRAGAGVHLRRRDHTVVAICNGILFTLASWIVLSPFVVRAGDYIKGGWPEIVVGLLLATVTFVRSATGGRVRGLSMVSMALGIWLAATAFFPVMQPQTHSAVQTVNDLVVGFLIIATSVVRLAVEGRAGKRVDTAVVPPGSRGRDA